MIDNRHYTFSLFVPVEQISCISECSVEESLVYLLVIEMREHTLKVLLRLWDNALFEGEQKLEIRYQCS